MSDENVKPITGEPVSTFNLGADAVVTPLLIPAKYDGAVTGMRILDDGVGVEFSFTLQGNGGVKSDGVTPIDATILTHTVWLPKTGDENVFGKNNLSKAQNKINGAKKFFHDNLKDPTINTIDDMRQAANEAKFMGREAKLEINNEEYQGTSSSKIKNVTFK